MFVLFQVQTIGDGYMVVSGAPIQTDHHAEYMTDFACSAIAATANVKDPSTDKPLAIRVGEYLCLSAVLTSFKMAIKPVLTLDLWYCQWFNGFSFGF